jgi:hypothetical protein
MLLACHVRPAVSEIVYGVEPAALYTKSMITSLVLVVVSTTAQIVSVLLEQPPEPLPSNVNVLLPPPPVPVHEVKVYPLFGVASIWTLVPASYHPVSPDMVGLVVAVEVPPPDGELTNVIWYWVAGLKFTVCAAVMVAVVVVKVVAWATLVLEPPSRFQEASLVPVPDERPHIPSDETVKESP